MIIRKKILNMMMGEGKQTPEQNDEIAQEDNCAYDEYEEDDDEYSEYEEESTDDEYQDEQVEEDFQNNFQEPEEKPSPKPSEIQENIEPQKEIENQENIEQIQDTEEMVSSPQKDLDSPFTQQEIEQNTIIQPAENILESSEEITQEPSIEEQSEGFPSAPETITAPEETPIKKQPHKKRRRPLSSPKPKEEEINLFDLDNIDFSQRQERRRGDRRRGFRRLDDRNLVSRAREEADGIRQAALNEGYQVGLEQAAADIDELKNSISAYMTAPQEVYEYITPYILGISIEIAKKIINKEIEQDKQVLFNTVVEVLKTLSKEEAKVTLRVNPAEVNELKQHISELIDIAGIDTKVVILSDENVGEGGCLVTTTNGIVDATIDSKISVVTQALKEL